MLGARQRTGGAEGRINRLRAGRLAAVFRRAGAIVAHTGSVLSHRAIVAREFALPAVVARIWQ